ncbi:energy transducer TonB [Rhizobium herbae]|uniref:Protein TonB n=1 Tax=Rhizobium herbae TaxID=508661 RepID=A0ABS7H7W9_9HYPH|nr:energy transducer TonB [Rhizobium herbae]MBW9062851.1 energy transducer TonB [Rhizobium herbae]
MNNTVKWTGAIVLSLLAHAGVAKLFEPGEEPFEPSLVAGGEAMEVAVLGNAFEQTIQAGDPTEAMEPEQVEPEEVKPSEVAEVAPVQSEVATEATSDIVPTEADVILPAEDIPPVAAEQPEVTATVAPVETVVPEEKPNEPKPEPEKRPEPKRKPEKEKPKKKEVTRKQAGDAGKQKASVDKGQADGVENAVASANSGKTGKRSQMLGNAAETRYSGKIRAKVNRHFRYPKSADRAGVTGTVTVAFTISSGGDVGAIRIIQSSGSPVLDEAATNAVRRAAPFPKIPEGANRSSWPFTLPLQFGR